MASSAAQSRRSFLRRPKVCLTQPNPGRCHPPPPPELPPRTCSVTAEQDSELPGDHGDYFIHACCEDLPDDQDVHVALTLPEGVIDTPNITPNCNEEGQDGDFENPGEEGEYTITATFTWSDSGVCVDTTTITVEEEENGDE